MRQYKKTILSAYINAFVSVIPYVVLMAIGTLLSSIWTYFDIRFIEKESLQGASTLLSVFFPLVLMIAISFQLGMRYAISQTATIFLSITTLIFTEALILSSFSLDTILFTNLPFLVLVIPLAIVKILSSVTSSNNQYQSIGSELNTSIKYIFTGILAVAVTVILLVLIQNVFSSLLKVTSFNTDIPNNYLLIIRAVSNHIFWFFGLHGSNLFDSVFGNAFLSEFIFPSMSYKQFYDLFVIYGGSGAGLSLILAIFLSGKDHHSKKIAKLALPFAIFNINEILIYGLPIVFNRYLLIPFLTVPIVNIIVAYLLLSFLPIEITATNLPWVTPIFINSYIATNGSIIAMALQLFLLILGTVIYMPFTKKYTLLQSSLHHSKKLSEKLNIKLELQNEHEIEANKAKKSIIQSNEETANVISFLEEENLFVYYQPKVDIKKGSCDKFEALLRIKMADGSIRGPFFLPNLEVGGLAPLIDLWVSQKVKEHLDAWKTSGFTPKISINLHPDTLSRNDVVLKVIETHRDNDVDIEIIERGLLDNKSAINSINLLKENGFSISIDDFGTGFSSLELLYQLPIDTLKIDKSITDLIHLPKGHIICKNIVTLCDNLGLNSIIEGVETEEQFKIVSDLGITSVQGYYFSPAISETEVLTYCNPPILT